MQNILWLLSKSVLLADDFMNQFPFQEWDNALLFAEHSVCQQLIHSYESSCSGGCGCQYCYQTYVVVISSSMNTSGWSCWKFKLSIQFCHQSVGCLRSIHFFHSKTDENQGHQKAALPLPSYRAIFPFCFPSLLLLSECCPFSTQAVVANCRNREERRKEIFIFWIFFRKYL